AILVFIGIAVGHSRLRWFWAATAALGLLLALGDQTPALRVAYYLLPGNRGREPIRWLLLSHLSASVLVGLGLDYVTYQVASGRRRWAFVPALLAAVTWLVASTMLK